MHLRYIFVCSFLRLIMLGWLENTFVRAKIGPVLHYDDIDSDFV
jgi:hypothetical protein